MWAGLRFSGAQKPRRRVLRLMGDHEPLAPA